MAAALIVIAASSARQISAQRMLEPLRLAPPGAVAVAKINWTIVRHDDRLRAMLNGEQLDRALAQVNINGSEVSEIVIISGINNSVNGVLAGIFRGSFSAGSVTSKLKSQGLTEEVYRGQTIYANPRDQSCTAVLRSGWLVIGSRKGVEGVIDVVLNPRLSLTSKPPFTTLLNRFAVSRQPITFMMALPAEYQLIADVGVKVLAGVFSLSGLGPFGFVIDKIGIPHAMGFSLGHAGAGFPAELLAQMKDTTSAALISGTLNVTQSLGLSMPSDRMSAADREMLKNVSVTRNGRVLSIKLVLREQDLPRPRGQ